MPSLRKIEQQQRLEHLRRQAQYELYWRNRIFIALRKQRLQFVREAKKNGLLSAYITAELHIKTDQIERVMNRMYRAIGPTEAEAFYRQFVNQKEVVLTDGAGLGQLSQSWFAALEEWLKSFLFDLIKRMTDTTKKMIIEIIANGIEAGDGYDQIIAEIENNGVDRVRAATIARTETNRAMGWAKWESISRLPYPADVVWIAARDRRTRGVDADDKADHYHMNGQLVNYPNPFTDPRSDSQLLFPGDVSLGAGPADTINCRCTIAARRRS